MTKNIIAGIVILLGLIVISPYEAVGSDVPGLVRWHCYWPATYGGVLPIKASSLPHFAVYPPVYYSHPIARPYGTSPFAQLPAAAEGGYIGPGTVLVNPSEPKANPAAPPSAHPLVIVNPFAVKAQ